MYVKTVLGKDFVMPIKTNRKIALSKKDKLNGKYVTVGTLEPSKDTPITIYLEGVSFPLLLIKQVFWESIPSRKKADETEGVLYLVSSDLALTHELMITIYQRR